MKDGIVYDKGVKIPCLTNDTNTRKNIAKVVIVKICKFCCRSVTRDFELD